MKIDPTTPPLPASQIGELAPRASIQKAAGNNGAGSNVNQGTSVNLGAATTQLRALEKDIANAPAVNTSKVDEIKQAISEGRFQVNPAAVAEGLINSVKDLISASQR